MVVSCVGWGRQPIVRSLGVQRVEVDLFGQDEVGLLFQTKDGLQSQI